MNSEHEQTVVPPDGDEVDEIVDDLGEPSEGETNTVSADAEGSESLADELGLHDSAEGKRLDELTAERDQIRDQHLRLAADFDNYRKRVEADLRGRWDRAQAELVGKLLEPLDDLQRVAAWEPETTSVNAIVEGVDLVERKFVRVIEDTGVEMIDPAGERFDPNTMEAMMRVPTDSPEQDELVEKVFQKGCTLKGQLVRPARVSVFKAE